MKLAYLFSGQGGKIAPLDSRLYESSPAFSKVFQRAAEISGIDFWQMWQTGDVRLEQTRFAQPAIFTLSTALYRVISNQLPAAQALVGLSLGEYSALAAAGALEWDAAFRLIQKRADLMQQASEAFPGAMAAVMSTDTDLIERVCREISQETNQIVQPANYNFPKQTVIGGQTQAVAAAVSKLTEAGIKRIVDLPVSGAFHTPLMATANDQFVQELAETDFRPMAINVISNTTGQAFQADTIKETLSRQMVSSTRFTDCLLELQRQGVTHVIELGPGHSLVSFAKKTIKLDSYQAVSDAQSLDEALAAVSN
ncbi:ACP S-malonyltransferase [Oenococcus kitaharae]|uniref:ACP S-malonyltransferase n=1 Tax=Oenococcus kitaharae TaxID=336988 RepID=UPI000484C274|nr:ACP S-malonyltransferase [Oenococcus kitaharae]OEY83036.1 ACP S-malonyltransferase [Oenococcus kitaharae]OEY84419.1 ACP S-malonyltransferase [Oenococcus kitaharae]